MEGATTRTVLNNFPRNWVSLFMTGPGVVIYKVFFFQFNHRNSNIAVQASNTAMRAQAMINRYISTGSHVKAYHGELTAKCKWEFDLQCLNRVALMIRYHREKKTCQSNLYKAVNQMEVILH